jgi:hypothetical protein
MLRDVARVQLIEPREHVLLAEQRRLASAIAQHSAGVKRGAHSPRPARS